MTEEQHAASSSISALQDSTCVDPDVPCKDPKAARAAMAATVYIVLTRAQCIWRTKENAPDTIPDLIKQITSELSGLDPLAGNHTYVENLVGRLADFDAATRAAFGKALYEVSNNPIAKDWGSHQHPTINELKAVLY